MATLGSASKKHKVAIIGSGNWGTTIAKVVAENTNANPDLFEQEVQMWVFEEQVTVDDKQQKLTEVINSKHENVKYLPNIPIPSNIVANPDLVAAAKDATILIFNLPHQFIARTCATLEGHIVPFARGISCIKGVEVTENQCHLFSESIGQKLGIYCGALSGANIATEVAQEKWSETTVAYDPPDMDSKHPTPVGSRRGSEADVSGLSKDTKLQVHIQLSLSLSRREGEISDDDQDTLTLTGPAGGVPSSQSREHEEALPSPLLSRPHGP